MTDYSELGFIRNKCINKFQLDMNDVLAKETLKWQEAQPKSEDNIQRNKVSCEYTYFLLLKPTCV